MIYYYILTNSLVIWYLVEIYISFKTKRNNLKSQHVDRGSKLIIIMGIVLTIFFIVAGAKWTLYQHNYDQANFYPFYFAIYVLGMILALTGIILRYLSVKTLGKYFTLQLQVSAKQQVIDTGLYSIVRHPAYSSTVITVIGFAFMTLQPLVLVLILIVNLLTYHYRIKLEEQLLSQNLGTAYTNYCKKVKYRLIPKIY